MRRFLLSLAVFFVVVGFLLQSSSCGKEIATPPNIVFKTDTLFYIYTDTTLYRQSIFNVGIDAGKTGTDGLLASCTIQRNENGGADSVIQEMNFVTQHLSKYYSYNAPDSGISNRYTFTVTEKDGMSSSINLTVKGK